MPGGQAPPKEGTKRYQKILDRGCGGREINIPGEPTEYDCDHQYAWDCEYCPCCIEAQRSKGNL